MEVVEGTERRLDRLRQRPVGLATPVRTHPLPEQRVVVVAARVVPDGGALVVGELVEALKDLLDRPVGPLGALERAIGLGHVGLVVLVVV